MSITSAVINFAITFLSNKKYIFVDDFYSILCDQNFGKGFFLKGRIWLCLINLYINRKSGCLIRQKKGTRLTDRYNVSNRIFNFIFISIGGENETLSDLNLPVLNLPLIPAAVIGRLFYSSSKMQGCGSVTF